MFDPYVQSVMAHIQAHHTRAVTGESHDCVVRLTVSPEGVVLALQTISCPDTAVERAALDAIAASVPLPKPPKGTATQFVDINLPSIASINPRQ
jgi:membrane protein involved in colicin uptake